MKSMYRDPMEAYVALDTSGKGHITKEDLLKSRPVQRIMATGATFGDLGECIARDSLFQGRDGNTDVDTFKRTFFP